MKKIAILAVVMLWPNCGLGKDACTPVLPELTAELTVADLPTSHGRWQAARRLWTEVGPLIESDMQRSLTTGWLVPGADLLAMTHDLLREAIREHEDDLSGSLLRLWIKALEMAVTRDRVRVYYQTPEMPVSEVQLDTPHEMWPGPDGFESVLYSAIFLAGATEIAATIARRSPDFRPKEMITFARRASALALSNYKRWAFGPPLIWQVRGWGCDASGLDLVEFTRKRMDRSLGNGRFPYCVAPTDIDMLIAIGILNLLATSNSAPDLAPLSEDDRGRLTALVTLQSEFMASRLSRGTTLGEDHKEMPTIDFDPGAWSAHPDHAYAGDEGLDFPDRPPSPKTGLGWDFSHGARVAWLMLTFAEHSALLGEKTDWAREADGLANNVAYRVLNTDLAIPRFRSYLDGSNGWHRVNYNDRPGSGYPPFGLSRSFLSTPWALLSPRNTKLLEATRQMWRALTMPSREECTLLDLYYAKGSYMAARRPAGIPFAGGLYSVSVLPFLALAPVR